MKQQPTNRIPNDLCVMDKEDILLANKIKCMDQHVFILKDIYNDMQYQTHKFGKILMDMESSISDIKSHFDINGSQSEQHLFMPDFKSHNTIPTHLVPKKTMQIIKNPPKNNINEECIYLFDKFMRTFIDINTTNDIHTYKYIYTFDFNNEINRFLSKNGIKEKMTKYIIKYLIVMYNNNNNANIQCCKLSNNKWYYSNVCFKKIKDKPTDLVGSSYDTHIKNINHIPTDQVSHDIIKTNDNFLSDDHEKNNNIKANNGDISDDNTNIHDVHNTSDEQEPDDNTNINDDNTSDDQEPGDNMEANNDNLSSDDQETDDNIYVNNNDKSSDEQEIGDNIYVNNNDKSSDEQETNCNNPLTASIDIKYNGELLRLSKMNINGTLYNCVYSPVVNNICKSTIQFISSCIHHNIYILFNDISKYENKSRYHTNKYYKLCNFMVTRCIIGVHKSHNTSVITFLKEYNEEYNLNILYKNFKKMFTTLFSDNELLIDNRKKIRGIYLRGQSPDQDISTDDDIDQSSRGINNFGRPKNINPNILDTFQNTTKLNNGCGISIVQHDVPDINITCKDDDGSQLSRKYKPSQIISVFVDDNVITHPTISKVDIMSLPIATQHFNNKPFSKINGKTATCVVGSSKLMYEYLGSYPLTVILDAFMINNEIYYKIDLRKKLPLICQLLPYDPFILIIENIKSCTNLNTRGMWKITINGTDYILSINTHKHNQCNVVYYAHCNNYKLNDYLIKEMRKLLVFADIYGINNSDIRVAEFDGSTYMFCYNCKMKISKKYNYIPQNRLYNKYVDEVDKSLVDNISKKLLYKIYDNDKDYDHENHQAVVRSMVISKITGIIREYDPKLICYINLISKKCATILN